MKRKGWIVLAVVLALSLSSLGAVYAITFGELDGEGHPYVGLVTFYDEAGNYMWRCTGTLMSPTVLMTAGHCTSGPYSARVWFDADLSHLVYPYEDCDGCVTGTPTPHYDYDDAWPDFPATHDVGVVVLDEEVTMDTYGALPALGTLDELNTAKGLKDRVIRTVGYGQQSVKPEEQSDRVRYTSTSMIVTLKSALTDGYNLHTTNNPGKGQDVVGGSCFGDSGGPVFYPEDSNIVIGIVSFGLNSNCRGADFAYRTDIADSQDFLAGYLP